MTVPNPMHCPECGRALRVLDSRAARAVGDPVVRRRRQCLGCLRRVTSYEVIVHEHELVMLVRKGTANVLIERKTIAEENMWGGIPAARPAADTVAKPRGYRCSICGRRGHNRRGCKVAA